MLRSTSREHEWADRARAATSATAASRDARPDGVATINFSAIESTGGSGAKNGPFYTAYGSNHEAGYLTAQAWQISRVLDVLQQNPNIIDPKRVGVTGCSRWGKGAFVAGALDNRIALTIPVESGLGGTVGLRLVERLDTYSGAEWPYHGISYVRWLSAEALGQFTTGNSASADNTDKLPVDMHEMMGLIAPRGLYIVDNPSTMYNGLDRNTAWATAKVGQMVFEALGVGTHMAYQGAAVRTALALAIHRIAECDGRQVLKGTLSATTGPRHRPASSAEPSQQHRLGAAHVARPLNPRPLGERRDFPQFGATKCRRGSQRPPFALGYVDWTMWSALLGTLVEFDHHATVDPPAFICSQMELMSSSTAFL